MDQASLFREAAAQANQGRERQGWRYDANLKAMAVDYCRERREQGWSFVEIARHLGISVLTLSRWLNAVPPSGVRDSFRPVEVVAEAAVVAPQSPTPAPLSVVTPGGFRIEGLSWPQVLELVEIAW